MKLTDTAITENSTIANSLFSELDKGIDDMEAGRVTSHAESMKIIQEKLGLSDV